ncbi:hypothetical protein PHLCEN_2v1078 [Hermanssonia centrifuga]|uniref:Uncharacterized protein n=1 Tax=Hermanssonia centrifuga TaxID=98765 RepID=A0A2R6S499_9APHY|nr:hypothetical protein PHLCEN_2v1078 [Hermanssonia centrifuga]
MSRRAFPNWGRARNVDRSQTNREYDNLAATSPEETISKLRSFHRGKNPERTNVAASIVQLFDSLAQRNEFAFEEIIHQYVMFGLHEFLLDIAMNQKIYPVRSNHNLEARLLLRSTLVISHSLPRD